MKSMLDIEELPCQDVHAYVGQTAHAIVCWTQSLSKRTDSLPMCLSFPGFLFMEGDDIQPPSTISITASSRSERPESNLHMGDVAASAFCHLELKWMPAGMARQSWT